MDCKSCKHYDNDWDGFCKLYPNTPLSPSPQVAPKMICNGNEYIMIEKNKINYKAIKYALNKIAELYDKG